MSATFFLFFFELKKKIHNTFYPSFFFIMTSTWHVQGESILLTKTNGSIIIKVGDFIVYAGHELGVKVDSFLGEADGPVGMEYTPWRGDHWAARAGFSMRGNPRTIICFPTGYTHYGLHINWDSVELSELIVA